MTDHTATLLAAIAAAKKRDDVVPAYAAGIASFQRSHITRDATDWSRVNRAIIERWSDAAISYIKDKAWKVYYANH